MNDHLIELLNWYAEMGVDLAVDEAPHNRFAESRAALERQAPPQQSAARAMAPRAAASAPPQKPNRLADPPSLGRDATSAAFAPETIERTAREKAAGAQTLAELRQSLESFEGCGLRATATQLVFGDGDPCAEIMFVGEAPGAEEDRLGLPFVGRAGQLLDKMLGAIGLDRKKVYIANVVPWRPPGNRTPTPLEVSVCLPFIRRQIELVSPKILVCLGASAAQTLLGTKEGIMRLRGRWFDYTAGAPRPVRALATLHPAYLLRQPAQKKLAWRDLRLIAKEIARLRQSD